MKTKRLNILLLIFICGSFGSIGQVAHIRIAHSSADTSLQTLDVWADTLKVADNLSFRNATGWLEISSSSSLVLRISPDTSSDTTGAFHRYVLSANNGDSNLLVINGFVSAGYQPYDSLKVHEIFNVRTQSLVSGKTDVAFYNGLTDYPRINIDETKLLNIPIVVDLGYGQSSNYQSFESIHYRVSFNDSLTSQVIREYDLKLAALGLENKATMVMLTGFYQPETNNFGEKFSLAIIPDSAGPFVELPESKALIQIIHNSADPLLNFADFYSNNSLLLDNFGFRTASSYLSLPSSVPVDLSVAPPNSISPGDSLASIALTLEADKYYCAVINGLENTMIQPFEPLSWTLFESKLKADDGNTTDIKFIHGCTNCGEISIKESNLINDNLFTNAVYGSQFDYYSLTSTAYTIKLFEQNSSIAALNYIAHLEDASYKGQAITWVLSGFKDSLSGDSSRALGLFAATSNGGNLIELEKISGLGEAPGSRIHIYPNPSSNWIKWNSLDPVLEIAITDVVGHTTYLKPNSQNECYIGHLKSGIYHFSIKTSFGVSVQRISIINESAD